MIRLFLLTLPRFHRRCERYCSARQSHLSAIGALLLGASLFNLSGCGQSNDVPAAAPPPAPPIRTGSRKPAQPSPVNRALAVWFKAIRQKLQEPKPSKKAPPGGGPAIPAGPLSRERLVVRPVREAEVAAIAHRHPAWRLANDLERSHAASISFVPLRVPRVSRVSAGAMGAIPAGAITPLRPLARTETTGASGFESAAERVPATGVFRLQANVQQQQEQAISSFLQEAEARQNVAASEHAADLRAELEEEIRGARNLDLEALIPELPSDPVQLEMTNLRLKLIPNSLIPEAERERVRQRLRTLEAQWAARLRQQEMERLEELRRLREELPRRIRREGEERIARELEKANRRYAEARAKVVEAQRTRLAQDFDRQGARLGINLPAAALPAQRLTAQGLVLDRPSVSYALPVTEPETPEASRTEIVKIAQAASTTPVPDALQHGPAITVRGALPPQLATQIRALRALAWNDAWRWAYVTARRSAWTRPTNQQVRRAVIH
ncbi:MAG: hypothetical protein M3347_17905 [Armatimonadota bacterium]|nr:hypothetical protein [Armatimonadota bacterium]